MKLLHFQIIFIFLFSVGCNNKAESSDNVSRKDSNISVTSENNKKDKSPSKSLDTNLNYSSSGLYRGIYFFDDVGGATLKENIDLIILINDTCSYLYFGGVLEKIFSINSELISFGGTEYPRQIYIGEGIIEDDGVNGSVVLKTGQSVNGMIKKVSVITEAEMKILVDAIKQEKEFFDFWNIFIGALNNDNTELLTEHVNFPFADSYGRSYPNKDAPRTYDAKNKSEFIKNYSSMFRKDVKKFLNINLPSKLYNEEVYNLFMADFRSFNFEKINGKWKLTSFPYFE